MGNYATSTQVQAYIRDTLGVVDQAVIEGALNASTSLIIKWCQRDFTVAGSASARLYTPTGPDQMVLRIHDCTSITSVVEWTGTVDPTAYQAEPLNQLAGNGTYNPYEQIRRYAYPWVYDFGRARQTVTATWGWAAIPAEVIEAQLITVKDLLAERNVGSGFAGKSLPESAKELLADLRRPEAFGIG